nr:AAA family ATPase [Desulfuromonadales bacterium]NIR33573.1 AAA family ATPase [Desulfuromonadales bacterium]NIS42272.1 AAA family ATPase [Desulfuromonadales bacterium]
MPETLHRHLLDPATYRESCAQVEFRETHISRVYLTDRHAFKFKKPLDLGFLDFSSLAYRRHFCQEELRLNRRFCSEIYLDVVTLNRSAEGYRINGPGETLDYAVRMKRLPEERMLDSLLADSRDKDLTAEIDRLADKLVEIYPTLPTFRASGDDSHVAMMRANWQENFRQTRPYIGQTINHELFELGRHRVGRLLDRVEPTMTRREKDGFVRDCHGDLHSRNICMTQDICIYDCIEFNRRFRIGDIIGDIAFLLMDLDFRNRRALSERLLEKAAPILGDAGDIAELIPFYKFYRAWVRGKVQSFLVDEEDTAEDVRREARQQALKYFNLGFGELAPSGLILTCGLSGTGKTTVARALSETTGAMLLRSDVIRKEIFGHDSRQARPGGFNKGLYTAEKTARTYAELRKRSEKILAEGKTVIADASFGKAADRLSFAALAKRCKVP